MTQAFVHVARLRMAAGADDRAPGGAITLALCGSFEHDPPCPLAAHHTAVERDGDVVALRILFATDVAAEGRVRGLIGDALAAESLVAPDGVTARWDVLADGPGAIEPTEAAHAQRLVEGMAG